MRYVYCIVEASQRRNLGNIGLKGAEVCGIPFKDLFAFASDLSETDEIAPEDARIHENVVLAAMNEGTAIPLCFGLLIKDNAEVEDLLRRGYFVFKETIERLRGTIQADIKVSWDSRILNKVLKEEGDIKAVYERLKKDPDNLALKIDLGRKVKEVISNMEKKHISEILDQLTRLSRCRENKIENHDSVLNASFLMESEKRDSFIAKIKDLEKAYEGIFNFRCVIPLPVYNFVGIHVKRSDHNVLNEAKTALCLGDEVTIREVNMVFNRLARLAHPDRSPDPEAEARFNSLKRARDLLIEYCENYPCRIARPDVDRNLIIGKTSR